MKNYQIIIAVVFALSLVGCVKVQYDNQYFRAAKPSVHQVGNTSISISIISDSPDAGPFNSKQQGPYFIVLKVKTEDLKSAPVIENAKVQSKEGTELELNEIMELDSTNYSGEGMLWTKRISESFQPDFYEHQVISVSITVEIDGEKQTVEKDFIPKHVKEPETVNILTM